MNFAIIDDNYVVNLNQIRHFYWSEEQKTPIVTVSLPEQEITFSPDGSRRMLQICLDKGIPVPKWIVEKYAD